MRPTRTVTASLVALLGAAALAGPAAADTYHQRDAWYAGKSTIEGSTRSDRHSATNAAKAKVYVPPIGAYIDPAAPAGNSAKANAYSPPDTGRIQPRVLIASAPSSGFDWGSACIGAAVAIGALLSMIGAAGALRRRRRIQPTAAG